MLADIGLKYAKILLNIAFDQAAFAMDMHVTRVCKHHKIIDEEATLKQIEEWVTEIIPEEYWGRAHQAIISFGRAICTPKILIVMNSLSFTKIWKKRRFPFWEVSFSVFSKI